MKDVYLEYRKLMNAGLKLNEKTLAHPFVKQAIESIKDTLKISYEVGDLSPDEFIKLQELRKEILKKVN